MKFFKISYKEEKDYFCITFIICVDYFKKLKRIASWNEGGGLNVQARNLFRFFIIRNEECSVTHWNGFHNISTVYCIRKLPLELQKRYLINRFDKTIRSNSSETCIRDDWQPKRVTDFMKIFKMHLLNKLFDRYLIYLRLNFCKLILSILWYLSY